MLKEGMRVLDIGCGWGGFAVYAAKHYGVEVVGITVSESQVELARERIGKLPITIELKDYRDQLKNGYDERFYRMWTYYLLSCAGTFRSRRNQLRQILFSKKGLEGGYEAIR